MKWYCSELRTSVQDCFTLLTSVKIHGNYEASILTFNIVQKKGVATQENKTQKLLPDYLMLRSLLIMVEM